MVVTKSNINKYFFAVWLVFLTIRPQCIISTNVNAVFLFAIIQIISIVYCCVITKELFINKFLLFIALYYIYDFINTYVQHSGSLNNVLIPCIWTISAIYFIELYIRKYGISDTFEFYSYAFSTFLWINVYTLIKFPDGLANGSHIAKRYTAIYFLGQYNQFSIYILIAVLLFACNVIIKKKASLGYIVFSIAPIFLTYVCSSSQISTTGMLGLMIIVVGIFLSVLAPKIVYKILSPSVIVIISILFFVTLTRLLTLNSVQNLIVNVLKKDVTLSERTTIWTEAYLLLSNAKNFIFGMGEVGGGGYIKIWTGNIFSAHNLLIQTCLVGGIILVMIFSAMFILAVREINMIGNRNRTVILVILLAFCFENMMEVFSFSSVIFCLFLFYLSGKYFWEIDRKSDK